jgi:Bacteriophage holin family
MKEWLDKLALASLAALAPIKMVMITVGILIMADLVTGIWAALKRGEKVSSAAMRRTVSKMFIYQLAVICGFMLETYILDGIVPVAKIVAGVIGMVEFKSILENSNHIVGGDLFKIVIAKLGSDNDTNKIKKE